MTRLPLRSLSRSGQWLLAILVVGFGVQVALWWIVGSYFSVDVFASISFFGQDGWCDADTQGVGIHCFGDYFLPAQLALSSDPWSGRIGINPYPGLSIMPFWLLEGTAQVLELPRLGLAIYLTALFFSVSAAAWWASRRLGVDRTAMVLLVIGPVSIPAIVALDRGNSTGLVVPFLLWFYIATSRNRRWQATAALVVMAGIKPQYAALAVALVALRWWKQSFLAVLIIAISHMVAFLVWPTAWLSSVNGVVAMAREYQQYSLVSAAHPAQFSFAHGLYAVEIGLTSIVPALRSVTGPTLAVSIQGVTGTAILLVTLLVVGLAGSRIPNDLRLILLIIASSLGVGTVYGYYGVVVLVVAAMILRPLNSHESSSECALRPVISSDRYSLLINAYRGLIVFAVVSSLVRLPLPLKVPESEGLIQTTSSIAALAWLLVVVVGLAMGVMGRIPKQGLFNANGLDRT